MCADQVSEARAMPSCTVLDLSDMVAVLVGTTSLNAKSRPKRKRSADTQQEDPIRPRSQMPRAVPQITTGLIGFFAHVRRFNQNFTMEQASAAWIELEPSVRLHYIKMMAPL